MTAGSAAPLVTIVGTTSSGKSTLLNAIMGEWLIPTGVQETTLVPTRITSLAKTGTWSIVGGPSAGRFRTVAKIRTAIGEHIAHSRLPLDIVAPKRRWWLPILGAPFERAFHRKPGVVLQDLPGFGSEKDTDHLDTWHQSLVGSRVVVTLLSASQTDDHKAQHIIEFVAKRSASHGEACLWILSQVDEFATNDDGGDGLRRRCASITQMVESAVHQPVNLLPVSARAALLASLLGRLSTHTVPELRTIENWLFRDARSLLPDQRLPRKPLARWSRWFRARLAARLWKASGVDQLERQLLAALQKPERSRMKLH